MIFCAFTWILEKQIMIPWIELKAFTMLSKFSITEAYPQLLYVFYFFYFFEKMHLISRHDLQWIFFITLGTNAILNNIYSSPSLYKYCAYYFCTILSFFH